MDLKQQTQILSEFPPIKLSYETQVHKKVYNAHITVAIPDGLRHYAWFTTHNNNNICWLLELSTSNKIVKVSSCITSFTDILSYGTILYGTVFKHKSNTCFAIEDMFYYKGKNIQDDSYLKKLATMKEMLTTELSMFAINKKYVVFGLPFMDTNFNTVLSSIETLPYKSSFLQFRYLEGDKTHEYYVMNYIKPRTQYNTEKTATNLSKNIKSNKAVFKVEPDIQNDIYKLYSLENGVYVYHDIAYIPTYTASVMMNKLFRNIKENANLDALEESDSESEFESNELDKHVFLDRSHLMNCEFNYKFKKWVPTTLFTTS